MNRWRWFKKVITGAILGIVIALTFYYFKTEPSLPPNISIDKLVVYKSKRELVAYSRSNPVKVYSIALGFNPIGHKEEEGDGKTPEGKYTINDKNPNSGYHKNLGISYPSATDIEHAIKLGKSPGSDIKIHGLRNHMGFIGKFHRHKDWTLGCIALTNDEIDELYEAVAIGTEIEIHQ